MMSIVYAQIVNVVNKNKNMGNGNARSVRPICSQNTGRFESDILHQQKKELNNKDKKYNLDIKYRS